MRPRSNRAQKSVTTHDIGTTPPHLAQTACRKGRKTKNPNANHVNSKAHASGLPDVHTDHRHLAHHEKQHLSAAAASLQPKHIYGWRIKMRDARTPTHRPSLRSIYYKAFEIEIDPIQSNRILLARRDLAKIFFSPPFIHCLCY